jgi:hypothetical protein
MQAEERAHLQIEGMKMKWPDIDQYIQDFKRVTRKAKYPLTAPATIRYFMKGLTKSIVNDIVKPPKVNTYTDIKQQVIDSVASQLLIYKMFKQDKSTASQPPSSQWNRFAQPNPTNQQPSRPNIRGYNSTNVPQHLNNAPVPMDVDADRTRANQNNNWRNQNPQGRTVQMQDEQGNVYQVNVAQTQPANRPPRGACYECNQVRHFARNCPNRKKKPHMATAQLVDWMSDAPTTSENPVDEMATRLAAMSPDQHDQVVAHFGGGVADWKPPRTVRDVRAFLGFTGYYRYFIKDYSKIARPLIHLTKKVTPFTWEEAQVKAFKTLKTHMCQNPILHQPDYTKPFFLATDTSAYGMGAVLLQEGEKHPRKTSPTKHPIAYYSTTFTPTECNYDIYERELLALMKALAHW